MERKIRMFIAHAEEPNDFVHRVLFDRDHPDNHIPRFGADAHFAYNSIAGYLDNGVTFVFTKKGLMAVRADEAHLKPEDFKFFEEIKESKLHTI